MRISTPIRVTFRISTSERRREWGYHPHTDAIDLSSWSLDRPAGCESGRGVLCMWSMRQRPRCVGAGPNVPACMTCQRPRPARARGGARVGRLRLAPVRAGGDGGPGRHGGAGLARQGARRGGFPFFVAAPAYTASRKRNASGSASWMVRGPLISLLTPKYDCDSSAQYSSALFIANAPGNKLFCFARS